MSYRYQLGLTGLMYHLKFAFLCWISSDEMDETGADYTEWSKPERKTNFKGYNRSVKPNWYL